MEIIKVRVVGLYTGRLQDGLHAMCVYQEATKGQRVTREGRPSYDCCCEQCNSEVRRTLRKS